MPLPVSLTGMLTHGREPGAFCHLSVNGLWPGDPNFTVFSLARCLRDLEFVPDGGDHTSYLSRTTSNIPLFSSLLDQSAFIATMGSEGAIDSTYFQQHGNGNMPSARDTVRNPTFKKLPPVLMLQMDNSAKDNKNLHVLAFCYELVIRGVFETVEVNFLMVGHTYEDVDALFSKVSAQTMHKDVLSLPALMAEIWDSEIMHPVPILLEEVADYKSYVHGFLKPLEGHSKPLGFRFSMVNNVPVYKYQRFVDGPWIHEAGVSLWKKVDGRYTVPDGEPLALKLPSSHPRLGEISPFISNLTDFLRTTYRDTTSEGYRKYSPVISYWKKVQKNITSIQALEDETIQNGFWPQTNQGTGYKPTGLPQDATDNGRDDTVVVLDELERELQHENNLMLEAYVGDPADRPKRAFIPLEDITERKFVVLRPDDDFEKEVPRVVWLGRAIGAVVRETSDERHGQFLIEWWRPRHRKSTNATNQERYTDILVGQKDWEKDPGYFTPEWINATVAIYSWKYRSKGGVPQSARLNPLAKVAIEAYFQMLDLVE
ncbi:hypothetical protein R1sor_016820 [Riccia sorocarpa]|uniref:DUF7869 domain-containing protein n=1 Tax=Riccia sorocarpa TaxID=122646 RepID=A0ABD3HHZ3_9MARC